MAGHNRVKYVEEDHEGKLYRVRDKHDGGKNPYIVWAENLTHEAAHALKERVVGGGRSSTARIENMDVPLVAGATDHKGGAWQSVPAAHRGVRPTSITEAKARLQGNVQADPELEAIRQKGMAAARGPAAASDARAAEVVPLHPPAPIPAADELVFPEIPEDLDGDIDELVDGV